MTSGRSTESRTPHLRMEGIFGQDLSSLGVIGVLGAPAARRWFVGGCIAVALWLAGNWDHFASEAAAAGQLPLRSAHVVLFMLAFVLIPPYSWGRSTAWKLTLL